MKKICGIKKFHHFRVLSSSLGLVFAKQWSDSPEVTFKLLKEPWTPAVDKLPAVVPPRGLSTECQWYLYDCICQFCPDNDKDTVFPLPSVPKPSASREGTPILEPDDPASPPPKRRKQTCGICNQEGHDCRSCPGI